MNRHLGSNERIHAFLRKLEQGKAVSVGVIGGSVSTGHGLGREMGRKSALSLRGLRE